MTGKKNRKTPAKGQTKKSGSKKAVSNAGSPFLTYLNDIKSIPILSKEEELETASLAALGNKAAKDKLVNSNLRFVVMIAKKFQGRGLALEDLVAEGNIGILHALKHFDPSKGCRFITYAVWWIQQAISKAIYDKGRMIRLPSNKSKELTRIEKTKQILENGDYSENGPEIKEIADFLNISPEKTEGLLKINHGVSSLDELVYSNSDLLTLKDSIEDSFSTSPVEHTINKALKDDINKALEGLEKREAEIIRCRYGLGEKKTMTLKEIGARYNLTRERVRQIEARAIRQLQQSPYCLGLKSYIA